MAPDIPSWSAVEEKLRMDIAKWKSNDRQFSRTEEETSLVVGASRFTPTGKGVATMRIGKLDWELTLPSNYTRYCETKDDWLLVSRSEFKVAVLSPHGTRSLQVCPRSDELAFLVPRAILPSSVQNLGLREGSPGMDVSINNLDVDDKLSSLLARFFDTREAAASSSRKKAEIIGEKFNSPFCRCVRDLQTAKSISDVLETILVLSAAYNLTQQALQQDQQETSESVLTGYFYNEQVAIKECLEKFGSYEVDGASSGGGQVGPSAPPPKQQASLSPAPSPAPPQSSAPRPSNLPPHQVFNMPALSPGMTQGSVDNSKKNGDKAYSEEDMGKFTNYIGGGGGGGGQQAPKASPPKQPAATAGPTSAPPPSRAPPADLPLHHIPGMSALSPTNTVATTSPQISADPVAQAVEAQDAAPGAAARRASVHEVPAAPAAEVPAAPVEEAPAAATLDATTPAEEELSESPLASLPANFHSLERRDKFLERRRIFDEFRRHYKGKKDRGENIRRPDLAAMKKMNEEGLNFKYCIPGDDPGAIVGDTFNYRSEMFVVGLHRQVQAGICIRQTGSDKIASSIVVSGGYEDDEDHGEILHYSGQGGNDYKGTKRQVRDQKRRGSHKAMMNSRRLKEPVRVIRGHDEKTTDGWIKKYSYDGLYKVLNAKLDRKGISGHKINLFKLKRLPGQPDLGKETVQFSGSG